MIRNNTNREGNAIDYVHEISDSKADFYALLKYIYYMSI